MAPRSSQARTLIRFSRIAAGAEEPRAIFAQLAEAAAEHTDADAVAVVEVSQAGHLRMAAQHGLAERIDDWEIDIDSVDEAVGESLRAACGGRYADAQVLPLMSHGAMFGALVLLGREPCSAGPALEMAHALADLAAVALGRAFQYRELERAYAELRNSREALASTTRLGALGQMAAGVSHDLKNILNPLSIHLQLLARVVPEENALAHESIAEMRDVIRRGVDTIDRLREFSRQQPIDDLGVADASQLAAEAAELARARQVSLRAYEIAVRTDLAPALHVRVQPSELVSAVVNLVVNAIDAMKGAGVGSQVLVRSGIEDGRMFLAVEDDGPGMAPEVARRAFEPFFSTKGAEGTGLGLANVYAFARRHGGDVALSTAPGEGARFRITLPLAESSAEANP